MRAGPAAADDAVILATERTNNQIQVVTLRLPASSPPVSAIRIRSGSLILKLVAVEIEFADGNTQRASLNQTLAPGQQSQPIALDRSRTIREITVVKQPGLRDGDTTIQIIGTPSTR